MKKIILAAMAAMTMATTALAWTPPPNPDQPYTMTTFDSFTGNFAQEAGGTKAECFEVQDFLHPGFIEVGLKRFQNYTSSDGGRAYSYTDGDSFIAYIICSPS